MQVCIDVVEYLRNKMIETAEVKGTFAHPDVISASQRLDAFILQAQRHHFTRNLGLDAIAIQSEAHTDELGILHWQGCNTSPIKDRDSTGVLEGPEKACVLFMLQGRFGRSLSSLWSTDLTSVRLKIKNPVSSEGGHSCVRRRYTMCLSCCSP